MHRVAMLFRNGRNQAVRLPVQFEFDTDRVYISQTENGDVILSKHRPRHDEWETFFNALNSVNVPDDFMNASDRAQGVAERDPFEVWTD
nr:virulence protein [Trabulsiella odontotermitis]